VTVFSLSPSLIFFSVHFTVCFTLLTSLSD